MRPLPILLTALFLVAAPALAQEGEAPTEEAQEIALTFVGHQEGSAFWWTVEGYPGRNPTLELPPGATVTATVLSESGVHNLRVTGADKGSDYVQPDGEATYTFTVPESGTVTYWCEPHQSAGMRGTIRLAAPGAGEGGEAEPLPPAPTRYVLTGHQEGSAFWWTVEGLEGRNPAITVDPGAEVTFVVRSESGVHNVRVTGADKGSDYVQPDGEATYTFTVPESGVLSYWCEPHQSAGMQGKLRLNVAAPPTPGGGEGDDIQGESVDLAELGYPECAGFLVPAIVTRNVAGGPTVSDYVDRCRAAEATTERHPADYTIPASFLLIGLGVVGVVWVHKFYKP